MTRLFICLFLALQATTGVAEIIRMKVSYYSNPLSDFEIKVYCGTKFIGSGKTDKKGDVTIVGFQLLSKAVDVYGKKKNAGADAEWKIRGYVVLNDANFYDLRLEKVIGSVSRETGISQELLAKAWLLPEVPSGNPTVSRMTDTSSTMRYETPKKDSTTKSNSSLVNVNDEYNSGRIGGKNAAQLASMSDREVQIEMDRLKNVLRPEVMKLKKDGPSMTVFKREELEEKINKLKADISLCEQRLATKK